MSAAVGALGKLGIGAASPVTYMLDFQSENFRRQDESVNGNGVRGTRSHHFNPVRAGLQRVNGPVNFKPTALDLANLFPWALCGSTVTVSGTNKRYQLGETAVTRYLTIDRHAKVFTTTKVGVNKATFRADQGQLFEANFDLIGSTETVGNAGTFPAIAVDVSTQPFILSDLALSVNSTTVTAKQFEITVDNKIDPDRFFNANVLSDVVMNDREVTFKTTLPYGDFTALYNLGAGTGIAVTATLTNGSVVLVFSLPKVVFPPMSPVVPGRQEVMLELEGRAYRSGSDITDMTTAELVTTMDYGA
jgi:hypothetical protein